MTTQINQRQTDDIAYYMDEAVREAIHASPEWTDGPAEWLRAALALYPTETREAAVLAGVEIES